MATRLSYLSWTCLLPSTPSIRKFFSTDLKIPMVSPALLYRGSNLISLEGLKWWSSTTTPQNHPFSAFCVLQGSALGPVLFILCTKPISNLIERHSVPHSGELRTQKLKFHLVTTQSLNVLPLKPGVCQYIARHARFTARDFFLAYFCTSGPFTCIFVPKPLPIFPVLAVANTWFLCKSVE